MEHFDTPATYSPDEAARIREVFARPDDPLVCPRCAQTLTVSPPITRHGATIQEVSCPDCHRCVILKNQPERPATT